MEAGRGPVMRTFVPRAWVQSAAPFEGLLRLLAASFAAWTVSYQIVLAARWPAIVAVWLFLPLGAVTAAAFALGRRGAPPERIRVPGAVIAAVLVLACAMAAASLVVSRPDADDIDYYHRPLVQSLHLGDPIVLGSTVHNVKDLPGLSTAHLLASYELAVAFAARLLSADPLSFYQNWACAAASFIMPVVYFLLFLRLGLKPLQAFLASSGAMAFLWLDGDLHAAFGNFAFVRLWQGKCLLLTLWLPVAALFSLDFWQRPGLRPWAFLFLSGVSAVGLSGTGIVVMPVLVFLLSFALAANDFLHGHRAILRLAAKAVLLNTASAYCLAAAAGISYRFIPEMRDLSHVPEAYWNTASWDGNLSLVLGTGWSVVWYAAVLIVGPLLPERSKKTPVPLLWSLAAVALCFNPFAGPMWLKALHAVYWRLLYLLPMALSAGLAAAGALSLPLRRRAGPWTWARLAGVLILVPLFSAHFRQATFSGSNLASFKFPSEYKIDSDAREFARLCIPQLRGANLLAPEEVAIALPLIDPSIVVEVQRPWVTTAAFRDAGDLKEGRRRGNAQRVVQARLNSEHCEDAFRTSISTGVDAVVVRNVALPLVRRLLGETPGAWRAACSDANYTLFLKGG